MAGAHGHIDVKDPGSFQIPQQLKAGLAVLMFLGALFFFLNIADGSQKRAWYAFIVAYFYVFTLAIGGLFLVAIQHVTSAGWSVNVRRLFEAFTSYLTPAFILGLVFLVLGAPVIYEWMHPEVVAKDHLLQHKAPYLNQPFFWVRFIGFFGLWLFFKKHIVGPSLEQDKSGEEGLTLKVVPYSVAFLLVFALSYSLFSVDTLMSLHPHWFSTIFGVYTFAGLFQSTIAFTILIIAYLKSKGHLNAFINENHLHDLGKFLFAFTVFWAYIAFSQYMLIWYANIPEETLFFIPRTEGNWLYVSLALIIFKFIVPFLALLPQWAKRNLGHLTAVSILILIMQYVDLYWLAYPSMNAEEVIFGPTEVFIFLGFVGLFLFSVTRFLSKNSMVPWKDPRIQESMSHHVVY